MILHPRREPVARGQIDVVLPVFNEENALPLFHRQLSAVLNKLPYRFRILYVDDGSTDGTRRVLERLQVRDRRIEVVELSRNFGHQAALTAGLDRSRGIAVITMDADGEHPPQLIPEMLRLFRQGYEVVMTQRTEGQEAGLLKGWTSSLFYWLLGRLAATPMPPRVADFRLVSGPVVAAVRDMREYHRFLRGMIAWLGFRTVILPFAPARRLAGTTKYSLRKMVRLALDATFSFSLVPLYLGFSLGVAFLALAVVEVLYVSSLWLGGARQSLAPGWSSLMFMLLLVGGTLLVMIGFVGIYVGYVFQEVKARPLYVIRRVSRPRPGDRAAVASRRGTGGRVRPTRGRRA